MLNNKRKCVIHEIIKVKHAIDTIIYFKSKPRTFDKQHYENGKNLVHVRSQFGANIKCDIKNIVFSTRMIVRL